MSPAIKIKGKLVGAETVVADISRLEVTLREQLKAEVRAAGEELTGRARALAPVLERPHKGRVGGELRGSISALGIETDKSISVEVGTEVFYGRFLESGWTPNPRRSGETWKRNPRKAKDWRAFVAQKGGRRIVAHPFLKPALGEMRDTLRDRLTAAVERVRL